ncbi:hypothetical protein FALB51S_00854 [Frigidibacter albus]
MSGCENSIDISTVSSSATVVMSNGISGDIVTSTAPPRSVSTISAMVTLPVASGVVVVPVTSRSVNVPPRASSDPAVRVKPMPP